MKKTLQNNIESIGKDLDNMLKQQKNKDLLKRLSNK